jgi:hypothetical protein
MKKEKENVKPNAQDEILVNSPLSIRQNSDMEFYNWKMEYYEANAKECCSI